MIQTRVQQTLQQVFSRPEAAQATRLSGDNCWAHYDAKREREVFEGLQRSDSFQSGSLDMHHPGHCMAVPSRRQAEFSGSLENGQMQREDSLFLTSLDTHGQPNIKTSVHTSFTPEGLTKKEAVQYSDYTLARNIVVSYDDPSLNYIEEFKIAH